MILNANFLDVNNSCVKTQLKPDRNATKVLAVSQGSEDVTSVPKPYRGASYCADSCCGLRLRLLLLLPHRASRFPLMELIHWESIGSCCVHVFYMCVYVYVYMHLAGTDMFVCMLVQCLYITRIGSIIDSIWVCCLHQLVRAHATLSVYEYVCT